MPRLLPSRGSPDRASAASVRDRGSAPDKLNNSNRGHRSCAKNGKTSRSIS